ncbi:VOC family protein [Micromonospora sp. CPCC 205371]|nr:VOC family protein [Micromonospora sp. CPCC 205371]
MLKGFATINYFAADLTAARDWYTEVLGVPPYFEAAFPGQPVGYYEFRIGDYQHELGLVDARYAPPGAAGTGGSIMYWHVDDLPAALQRLLALGATEHDPIRPRGDSGFVTASVVDPFGNILGIMTNPHYLEILESTGRG